MIQQKKEEYDVYLRSNAKRHRRNMLASNYYTRIENWLDKTASSPDPDLNLTLTDERPEWVKNPHSMAASFYRPRQPENEVGGARMSARTYVTERERINHTLAQRATVTQDIYRERRPISRERFRAKELGPSFSFTAKTESERINTAIKMRDVGGVGVKYRGGQMLPNFRSLNEREKWKGRSFVARFPEKHPSEPIGDSFDTYSGPEPFFNVRVAFHDSLRKQMYTKGPVSKQRFITRVNNRPDQPLQPYPPNTARYRGKDYKPPVMRRAKGSRKATRADSVGSAASMYRSGSQTDRPRSRSRDSSGSMQSMYSKHHHTTSDNNATSKERTLSLDLAIDNDVQKYTKSQTKQTGSANKSYWEAVKSIGYCTFQDNKTGKISNLGRPVKVMYNKPQTARMLLREVGL